MGLREVVRAWVLLTYTVFVYLSRLVRDGLPARCSDDILTAYPPLFSAVDLICISKPKTDPSPIHASLY